MFLTFLLSANVHKTITCSAGKLSSLVSNTEKQTLTNLTITGTIDARDFRFMRDSLPMLAELDIEDVTIAAYNGTDGTCLPSTINFNYPADAIPTSAFFNSEIATFNNTLKTVILPRSVSVISQKAFYACSSLSNINLPISITKIEYGAFAWCQGFDSIKISSYVTEIGQSSFRCNSAFIMADKNNPNYSSNEGVLFDKNQTKLIQCPTSKLGKYIIPQSVTVISYEAFENVEGITELGVPTLVNYIDKEAFLGCSNLISIIIPNSVTLINDRTFSDCLKLKSVVIPSTIKSIGKTAFGRCQSLISINIPSSVTSIGASAFLYSSALITIYVNYLLKALTKSKIQEQKIIKQ